ncbi:PBSX family phage terminase large subunit [Tumebacillus sp. ITR2]|uniref:PBSX family phage terminase large subunit n=1 Tax=Tumebacillus amylolyticus TaxID=2801339 RepID=A0ABS1JCC1_9BACL|nr:PBSX family phage terminase large subunit [Tumebacillus amylolyticus]MBL0387912.1 PBSX family phage terminase large subunit [Tumebacillus amylolyticus]
MISAAEIHVAEQHDERVLRRANLYQNPEAFQKRLDRARTLRDASKKSRKKKPAPFKWLTLSQKQQLVLSWWTPESPVCDRDAIICDGSVRAGKTVCMSFSYVDWAMSCFHDMNFGLAGKTIGALRRNVITPLKRILRGRGYKVVDRRADNQLVVTKNRRTNTFYIFGGKDESSQDLIQGITLAGMFFDEVALMPESFVNQATARCSVTGAKFWFNCNPAGPYHWFKVSWLDKLREKNALHLHFTMHDNLSLDKATIQRYENLYKGSPVFYKRYILGLWVVAEGVVYDMFDDEIHKIADGALPNRFERYHIGVDAGQTNATVYLLIGELRGKLYVIREYYHESKAVSKKDSDDEEAPSKGKAPSEYAADFLAFTVGLNISNILIDPAGKWLRTELEKKGVRRIINADNDVLPGISSVQVWLTEKLLFVAESCKNLLREFGSYIWDVKAAERGEDKPVKKFDHALDALRYVVYTLFGKKRASVHGRVVGKSVASSIKL